MPRLRCSLYRCLLLLLLRPLCLACRHTRASLTTQTCCNAGITRERLESLDRKITCEPEDFPDKRGALINDFQRYLGIIKAVHEGADLQACTSLLVQLCYANHVSQ